MSVDKNSATAAELAVWLLLLGYYSQSGLASNDDRDLDPRVIVDCWVEPDGGAVRLVYRVRGDARTFGVRYSMTYDSDEEDPGGVWTAEEVADDMVQILSEPLGRISDLLVEEGGVWWWGDGYPGLDQHPDTPALRRYLDALHEHEVNGGAKPTYPTLTRGATPAQALPPSLPPTAWIAPRPRLSLIARDPALDYPSPVAEPRPGRDLELITLLEERAGRSTLVRLRDTPWVITVLNIAWTYVPRATAQVTANISPPLDHASVSMFRLEDITAIQDADSGKILFGDA